MAAPHRRSPMRIHLCLLMQAVTLDDGCYFEPQNNLVFISAIQTHIIGSILIETTITVLNVSMKHLRWALYSDVMECGHSTHNSQLNCVGCVLCCSLSVSKGDAAIYNFSKTAPSVSKTSKYNKKWQNIGAKPIDIKYFWPYLVLF